MENESRASWQPTVAVLLLAVIAAVSIYQAIATPSAPTKYEYKVEVIPDADFQPKMNLLGLQGWEAISARRANDGNQANPTFSYEIIFRRPVGRGLSVLPTP